MLWTLNYEILFYLIYPFIVLRLIRFAKRKKYLHTILITTIILATFILISELHPALHRASGFIFGVIAATLFNSKNWKRIKKWLNILFFQVLIVVLFLLVMIGDINVREKYLSASMENAYFYLENFSAMLVVLLALGAKTKVNKLLEAKVLTFIGLISYSLYLSHVTVILLSFSYLSRIDYLQSGLGSTIFLLVTIAACIVVAYILYKMVESLYFETRKKRKVNYPNS